MGKGSYDPNTRRLRRFILLVIFVVTLPSLMLSGFGLIAIRNERSAAYRQMIQLYRPVLAKVQRAVVSKLTAIEKSSAELLEAMAMWGMRKAPAPAGSLRDLLMEYPALVDFFVMTEKGQLLVPSAKVQLSGFSGFLPKRFIEGRKLEFQSNDPCKAVGEYRSILGELDGTPARCAVFNALSWRIGNSTGFKHECERMLAGQDLDPGLKCVVRNALARSLDSCGHKYSAAREWGRLADLCPRFVNQKGYNLALGARLRRMDLLAGKDHLKMMAEAGQLVSCLADPLLRVRESQRRFVARRAAILLGVDRSPKARAFVGALRGIDRSCELYDAFAGLASNLPEGVSLRSVKAAGRWRMVVVNRKEGVVSGVEIVPGIVELGLRSLLQDMNVNNRVTALIRSADQLPGEDEEFTQAVTSLIPKGQFAWRLNLALIDKGVIEELANARTRLYTWVLVLLIVVLVFGIVGTVWIMIRETRLSRLKTDFVSNVSHELRTPLTSIRLFTDTLLMNRASDEKEKEEFLQIISRESDRLSRLVERILDFSRMEAGRRAFVFERTFVQEMVDSALYACGSLAQQRNIKIIVNLAKNLAPVYVDSDAMMEVLINLLSNAIKYSNEGSVVEIDSRVRGQCLLLSVKDYGIGIAKAEQARVFEKFYRIEPPLISQVSGSGLGLSLVKYIVEGHGGKVEVQSAKSKGSTFTVFIPVAQRNKE